MRKSIHIFIRQAACLSISLCIPSCSSLARRDLEQKLISAIEKKRDSNEKVVVDLKSITNFSWDRFYAFGPYTDIETIHKTLGFSWPKWNHNVLDDSKRIDLLVFVRGKEVVQYIEYPREHGDFYKVEKEQDGYAPDEAVFEVVIEDHGVPALVPQRLVLSGRQ